MRLELICHGPTEAVQQARFPQDEDVDPQALATAPRPHGTFDRWLSGPELRARRTACELFRGSPITPAPELRDWNCDRWAGSTLSDIGAMDSRALEQWLTDPSAAPHGGESLLELLARVSGFLETQSALRGRTAAVTHPAVLKAAIAGLLGAGTDAFWRIDAKPFCRARLSHDGRRWTLQSLVPP